MAEKLYFIKINPVAAKINLYNKLCRDEDQVLEFLEEDKKTSLELIRKKVQGDIQTLSKEELLCIFSWFNTKYASDPEEMKTQLFVHGIDLFYEITSPMPIENIRQIMSDYEKHTSVKISQITDSENFNQFLIYGIFFTGLMNKTNNGDYLFDTLKSQHTKTYSLAENEYHSKNSEQPISKNTYEEFKALFDCTRFYKGPIIELYRN